MAGVRVETALGEVPKYPEVDIFWGFFFCSEYTVGFVLSLLLKTGVAERLWCACWSPSLCFSMEH